MSNIMEKIDMFVTPKPHLDQKHLCPGQVYTIYDVDEEHGLVFVKEKFGIPGFKLTDLLQVFLHEDGRKTYQELV